LEYLKGEECGVLTFPEISAVSIINAIFPTLESEPITDAGDTGT
jgi:hypothetical protein